MSTRRWLLAAVMGLCIPTAAFADKTAKAADDLSYLPVDSEVVGGLDFAGIQTSPLWKKFVDPLLQTADVQKKFAEFKTLCGVDPMKSVTKIAFGLKGVGGSGSPEGVFVAHGVPKQKLMDCMGKSAKAKSTEVTREGDIILIKSKDGQPVAFTFVDDSTAIAVIGTNATKDGVTAAAKGGSSLKTSPAFLEMYKKTKTTDTLWMLMNGNSKAFDKFASMGLKPKAIFGSVNVGAKDVTADMRIRLNDAAQAKQLATQAQGSAQQAAAFFDKILFGSDGADFTVAIGMSNAKVETLIGMVGSQFGAGSTSTTPPTPAPAPTPAPSKTGGKKP